MTVNGDFCENGGELRACGGGVVTIIGNVHDGGKEAITVESAPKISSNFDLE